MSKCVCTLLWGDAVSENCQVPSAHWGGFLNSVFPKSFPFSVLDWLSVSGSSHLFAFQKTSASFYASTSEVSSQSCSDGRRLFPKERERSCLSGWCMPGRIGACKTDRICAFGRVIAL